MCDDKVTFTVDGLEFTAEITRDTDMGYPWEEWDGYGVIERVNTPYYGRVEKKPGQVVIYHGSRNEYTYLYDVPASIEKAKKEGWGVSAVDTTGMTKKQIIALAVARDMAECKEWLNGNKWFIWAKVYATKDGEESSYPFDTLGGIEYGYSKEMESYAIETFQEMAGNILYEKREAWRKALAEARQRKYWASRDVETVGV